MKYFLISSFLIVFMAGCISLLTGYFLAAGALLSLSLFCTHGFAAVYFYQLGQSNLVTGGQLVMQANQANDEMDAAKIRAIGGLINGVMNAVKSTGGLPEDGAKYLLPEPGEIRYSPFVIENEN